MAEKTLSLLVESYKKRENIEQEREAGNDRQKGRFLGFRPNWEGWNL